MQSISSKIVEFIVRYTGVKKRNNALLPKRSERTTPPPNYPPPKKFYQEYAIEEHALGENKIWLLGPRTRPAKTWIFYIHGGAFVDGVMPAHWQFLGRLVKDVDALIAIPDYPLTPKANAQQTMKALIDGYHFFQQHSHPQTVICMGDSSGGGMSVVLSQQLTGHQQKGPSQLILLSPWLDISLKNPAIEAADRIDPMLGLAGLKSTAGWYSKDLGLEHPLANPMHGNLGRLPPVTLFIGSHDLLQPDCELFRDKLLAAGVEIDYRNFDKMLHIWMFLPVKEAKQVHQEIAAKLRSL
ncbi:MAG: alpha/beta hydrolase [Ketobacter sp.]|nr:MAG: alpha/beta hydrolase [Ketobacter sp.]